MELELLLESKYSAGIFNELILLEGSP